MLIFAIPCYAFSRNKPSGKKMTSYMNVWMFKGFRKSLQLLGALTAIRNPEVQPKNKIMNDFDHHICEYIIVFQGLLCKNLKNRRITRSRVREDLGQLLSFGEMLYVVTDNGWSKPQTVCFCKKKPWRRTLYSNDIPGVHIFRLIYIYIYNKGHLMIKPISRVHYMCIFRHQMLKPSIFNATWCFTSFL